MRYAICPVNDYDSKNQLMFAEEDPLHYCKLIHVRGCQQALIRARLCICLNSCHPMLIGLLDTCVTRGKDSKGGNMFWKNVRL